MSCWDDISRHIGTESFWMSDPTVRRRIGSLVSGDPDFAYPVAWFARTVKDELLLRHPRLPGARSFHAAVIARKRPAPSAAYGHEDGVKLPTP
jgi:hypothetical protein